MPEDGQEEANSRFLQFCKHATHTKTASIGNLEKAWPWGALPTSVVEELWHMTVSVLLTLTAARWFMLPFVLRKWLRMTRISAGQMTASNLDGMQFNFRTMHVEYLVQRVALRQVTAELFCDRLPIVSQKVFTSSGPQHFSCGLTSDPICLVTFN